MEILLPSELSVKGLVKTKVVINHLVQSALFSCALQQ